jgi:hypothetical protein
MVTSFSGGRNRSTHREPLLEKGFKKKTPTYIKYIVCNTTTTVDIEYYSNSVLLATIE